MALQVTPKYPDAQAMEKYHLGHPIFKSGLDTVDKTTLFAPGIFKQLAALFGGKEVPGEKVDEMIYIAIRTATAATKNADKIKLLDLWLGVRRFTDESKDNSLSNDLRSNNDGIKHIEGTAAVCRSFLKDVLAGARFEPPKAGTTNWIRIVPNV